MAAACRQPEDGFGRLRRVGKNLPQLESQNVARRGESKSSKIFVRRNNFGGTANLSERIFAVSAENGFIEARRVAVREAARPLDVTLAMASRIRIKRVIFFHHRPMLK